MKKDRRCILSHQLLHKYLDAAMTNASDLLIEATTFLSQKRYARAYFLACASLEETGKAYAAFSAMGRNLKNLGVAEAVKESFEDHRRKIISAMICILKKNTISKETAEEFTKIALDLEAGRERSMYVDINDKHEVTEPSKLVRPVAAFNAVRLAQDCHESTANYINENKPEKVTASQDKFMTLNKRRLFKMANTKDFWEFYIHQPQKKNFDIGDIFTKYHDEYYCKQKLFEHAAKKAPKASSESLQDGAVQGRTKITR
jgi:AbiV family abortive infection protein